MAKKRFFQFFPDITRIWKMETQKDKKISKISKKLFFLIIYEILFPIFLIFFEHFFSFGMKEYSELKQDKSDLNCF